MLSNAYFLAKFRFDTAENEPAKNLQNFRKMHFEARTGLGDRRGGRGGHRAAQLREGEERQDHRGRQGRAGPPLHSALLDNKTFDKEVDQKKKHICIRKRKLWSKRWTI